MKSWIILLLLETVTTVCLTTNGEPATAFPLPDAGGESSSISSPPIGPPGRIARYRQASESNLPSSVVKAFRIVLGPITTQRGTNYQWFEIEAAKANGKGFHIWFLSAGYPALTLKEAQKMTARYIVQEGEAEPREFRHQFTARAVLPSLGGWEYLIPRAVGPSEGGRPTEVFSEESDYLGYRFRRESLEEQAPAVLPPPTKIVELLPDVLIGLPHNTRLKDGRRQYDESAAESVRFTGTDYREMAEAGFNCLHVDAAQLPWIADANVFYWGLGGGDLPYPECLYRSCYLGPELFLDEPAVGTRDYVIRPRLAKDTDFRKSLTPQVMFAAFQEYFQHAIRGGTPAALIRGLAARPEVALGTMQFAQANLFSWETMVCTAAHQLSQDPHVPAAMVFEPPGRVGSRRTLPELDMTYGCQLPPDDPKSLADLIYGFLRGAARLTGKEWGTSIYGAVDRADSAWLLTHAYDLGATRFFFWDTAGLAGVPYQESLALARSLRAHAKEYPNRDFGRLTHAAEVAILFPPGYNLGHVSLGKGSLWGLGELNLERRNQQGVKYRAVMDNFFTEIERCFRLGVAFDLLWDLPNIHPVGYREVIHIREDGKVEVKQNGKTTLLDHAREPSRPDGDPPKLIVSLSAIYGKAPLMITARAVVAEQSAPVYYTLGADSEGVYHNAVVAWELYGPGDEDYRFLMPPGLRPAVHRTSDGYEVEVHFPLERPGSYRLRAATVDMAGRSTVSWSTLTATE
jgi:hypothetical protein